MGRFLSPLLIFLSVSLKAKDQSNADPKSFFMRMGKALIGAYEELGELSSHYDETGYCGQACSVWNFHSDNPTLESHLLRFKPITAPGVGESLAGYYHGYFIFWDDKTQLSMRLNLDFLYSGEDISATLQLVPLR